MHESLILKPKDDTILDSNEWPEFTLENATVFNRDGSTMTSLLDANLSDPVIVRGRLGDIDPEYKSAVISPGHPVGSEISVDNVTQFAHAKFEDGTIGFWAAGSAGWFEVTPSKDYEQVYQSMAEGVQLLYFLEDHFSGCRRSGQRRFRGNVQDIYRKYMMNNNTDCNTVEEVATLFHSHKSFLISTMCRKDQNIKWGATPFYAHMRALYPNEFGRAWRSMMELRGLGQVAAAGSATDPKSDSAKTGYEAQEDSEEDIVVPSRSRKRPGVPPDGSREGAKRPRRSDQARDREDEEEVDSPSTPHRSKGLLRPRSQLSGKATARQGLAEKTAVEEDAGSSSEEGISPVHSLIRERMPVETRARGSPDVEMEDSDGPDAGYTSAVLSGSQAPNPPFAPNSERPKRPSPPPPSYGLHKVKLPTYESREDGDIWRCSIVGCMYKIRDASLDDGQLQVREHFLQHAKPAQDQIDLVYEESRRRIPVRCV
ncbi:MAG: hypothetical protein M1825_003212 [Sarcosagium campestre]|nr:MAG: hypothetical protein M1825_003212 [Sarcosagium campestre]